jgi:tetratricopeptide (TPR) repeat protein
MSLPEGADPARIQEALATLRAGRDRYPDNPKVRESLGKVLAQVGLLEEAEAEYRAAVGLPGADRDAYKRLAKVLRRRGMLVEALGVMAAAPKPAGDGANILIACIPKSGSSWLRVLLGSFEFLDAVQLSPLHDRREQELDFMILNRKRERFFVAQQHVRANRSTDFAVKNYNIATTVLVRNIPDALVSARDHFAGRRPVAPQFYMDSRFKTWDEDRQYRFLLDFYVPWVVNFIATGWHADIDTLWLTYDLLRRDSETAVRCVLEHAGFAVEAEAVQGVVDRVNGEFRDKTLFNVGEVGRGAALPDPVHRRIRELCAYYPEIPFERLGLIGTAPATASGTG